MRRLIIFCISLFIFNFLQAQTKDTIFNQTDAKGLKQGFWKVKYDNGSINYTAFFKNGKPVGLMKRYFEDQSLKAEMNFSL